LFHGGDSDLETKIQSRLTTELKECVNNKLSNSDIHRCTFLSGVQVEEEVHPAEQSLAGFDREDLYVGDTLPDS
jgi:hypothetical protein